MDCAALIIFPPRNRGCVSKLFTIEVRPPLSSLAWKIYFSFRLSVSLNLARLFAIGEKTARSALSIFPPPPFSISSVFGEREVRLSTLLNYFVFDVLLSGKSRYSLSLCVRKVLLLHQETDFPRFFVSKITMPGAPCFPFSSFIVLLAFSTS